MNASWLVLNPKIKAALAAWLVSSGASLLAAWNGTLSWHVAIGLAIGGALSTLAGYLTPAATAVKQAASAVKSVAARSKRGGPKP